MRTSKPNPPKTLQELRELPKEILSPDDISGVLHCHPYSINLAAQSDPGKLGFPVVVMGSRIRIPKAAFIRFMEGIEETAS